MTRVRRRELITALVVCVFLVSWNHLLADRLPGARPVDRYADVLVACSALALVWRRLFPRRVLAATTLLTTVYLLLGFPYGPVFIPFAVSVYSVARHLPWRGAALAGGIAIPVLALHNAGNGLSMADLTGLFPAAGWVAVPFTIGTLRAQLEETGRRDHREAVERGIQEERLRMAQEVHDIVGHGLAAIKMQADIALHVLARQPGIARPTLEAVSSTSAQALDELRTTLRILRSADAVHASTPGIADLDALYGRMRAAGLQVRVHTVGSPNTLPAEADLAAYRTIQESLTNVLKHAYPKEADIVLENQPGALRIRVTSAYPPAEPPSRGGIGAIGMGIDGLGIDGMRERIAAQGGRLSAGPDAGSRFVVEAWLPAVTP
ncbi:sensor histidine kinase [Actinoplanes sp. GCM10030250]|uniref:sensor histidine kinase n=1 Tax=Actinoplanes sp. GCM10030250 TaxID=3273376 RepID=UPI0036233F22